MAIIFVSHSSHDDAFSKRLCRDLKLIGHSPWIDFNEIRPGDSIISSIEEGITESSHAIVVVSKSSIQSDWVNTEWKEKHWDAIKSQKIRIIPVLLELAEPPLFLRTRCHANFTQSYAVGFAELCLTLRPANRPQVPNILDLDFLHAIENSARHHQEDHVRLACAHTVWSCRPDRAKPILEDAKNDWRDLVRVHAQVLLEQFY